MASAPSVLTDDEEVEAMSRAQAVTLEFNRDSTACTAEASPTPGAARYGVVVEDVYRACMRAHGWARQQSHEPIPPGYFRGPHE
jgi:hypothetical protein